MFPKFVASSDSTTNISMENLHVFFMTISMISGIIEWLNSQKVYVDIYPREVDHSSLMFNARIRMNDVAPHCFSNSVFHQAVFVLNFYGHIKETLSSGNHLFMFVSRGQIELYLKMTNAYQEYEDKVIKCNQEVYGKNFGSAQKRVNWLEHNAFFEKLLTDNS